MTNDSNKREREIKMTNKRLKDYDAYKLLQAIEQPADETAYDHLFDLIDGEDHTIIAEVLNAPTVDDLDLNALMLELALIKVISSFANDVYEAEANYDYTPDRILADYARDDLDYLNELCREVNDQLIESYEDYFSLSLDLLIKTFCPA